MTVSFIIGCAQTSLYHEVFLPSLLAPLTDSTSLCRRTWPKCLNVFGPAHSHVDEAKRDLETI